MLNNKSDNKKIFDLEERTSVFAENIIRFAKKIPRDVINIPIIGQLVKAGTSVGSNYCEADCAETRKDFEHKIGICKKESRETRFWLRQIVKAEPSLKKDAIILWKEANELNLIFIAIIRKSKANAIKKFED